MSPSGSWNPCLAKWWPWKLTAGTVSNAICRHSSCCSPCDAGLGSPPGQNLKSAALLVALRAPSRPRNRWSLNMKTTPHPNSLYLHEDPCLFRQSLDVKDLGATLSEKGRHATLSRDSCNSRGPSCWSNCRCPWSNASCHCCCCCCSSLRVALLLRKLRCPRGSESPPPTWQRAPKLSAAHSTRQPRASSHFAAKPMTRGSCLKG
mmetsp:Transcript_24263/g.53921  ORF Transcript_24263/g.53921 Transcript_24263/m.53921 type:complete len:205 (+) Transcript_24263:226-840(+)